MDKHEWPSDDGQTNFVANGSGVWSETSSRTRDLRAEPQIAAEILRLAEQEKAAQIDANASEATLHMAVARLGGLVEGHPTHRINFLQRIDALRKVEERERKLRAAALRLLDAQDQFYKDCMTLSLDKLRSKATLADDSIGNAATALRALLKEE